MHSSSSGPLTSFLKEAGIVGDTAVAAARGTGRGLSALGGAVWNAAGHMAPHPAARVGLLGATALGVGTQVPHLAGRVSNDARYVRGEVPSPTRGF